MNVRPSATVETAVLGGGMIGLSVAFELASRGQAVCVLERERAGAGAGAAAAGMLAPVSEADVAAPALMTLGLDSARRFPEFVERVTAASGLLCGYRSEGTLWVALNHDHEADLNHLCEAQRLRGVSSRRVTADEVFAREPHLTGRVLSGLYVEEDRQVDPRLLARSLAAAITKLGGAVHEGVAAERVDCRDGRLQVSCRDAEGRFEVSCRRVVVAAGAWTSRDLEAPLPPLGVRPVKGQVVRLRGPVLLRHIVRTPDAYLVPREDGELLVGATMEEMGFDATPTAGAVLDLLRRAWQVLPGIYDLGVSELSVGFRPAAVDNLPVIGPTEVEGLYVATGHFRDGVLLAPATAHYLAEAMTSGSVPAEIERFDPQRFTEADSITEAQRHGV